MDGFQKVRKEEYIMSARHMAVLKLRLDDKEHVTTIAEQLKISTKTIYKVFRDTIHTYPNVEKDLKKVARKNYLNSRRFSIPEN